MFFPFQVTKWFFAPLGTPSESLTEFPPPKSVGQWRTTAFLQQGVKSFRPGLRCMPSAPRGGFFRGNYYTLNKSLRREKGLMEVYREAPDVLRGRNDSGSFEGPFGFDLPFSSLNK